VVRVTTAILKAISRRTATAAFVPEIDGLRFVAILWVVIYHIAILHNPATHPILRAIARSGHYGVPLFFIISGFVLALPFATWRLDGAKPVSLRRYYLRRVTRLEPPYLSMLAVYFAVRHVLDVSKTPDPWARLFTSATYTHNLVYAERSEINDVAWSLEIEVQFYILAPLIGCIFLLRSPVLRRCLLVAAITLGMTAASIFSSPKEYARLWLSLPMYLHFFLIGFLLADLFVTQRWRERPADSALLDVAGVASLAALAYVISDWYGDPAGACLGPILSGVLCVAAFHGRLLHRCFRNPWIYSFGGMCYTIYLFHTLLVHGVAKAMTRLPAGLGHSLRVAVQVGLTLGLVAAICPVIFVLLERPFMNPNWPGQLWQRLTRSREAVH
jgi:peptidoglycan/LPS O-acetylase OafA/YrhL